MIQNFIEADLIELFSSLPVYIGDKEGGEMLFERKYDNDISLLIYFNVYEEKVEMIKKHAELLFKNKPEKISKKNIDKIYGDKIKTSVSRLEQYERCPFSYYLKSC